MKTSVIAFVAAAALGMPFVTTADARDYRRHDEGHGHHHRDEVYSVRYHLEGSRNRHADDHEDAHRLEAHLESLGAEVHTDGDHDVHYHMHGSHRRTFSSHRDAHRFAGRLRSLGFHTHVYHD